MAFFNNHKKKFKLKKQKKYLTYNKTVTSGEKIIKATENIKRNARVKEIRMWMRVVAGAMCIVIVLLAFFIGELIKNNMSELDFLKTESYSTDSNSENEIQSDNDSETLDERLLRYVNTKNKIDTNYLPELYEYNGIMLSRDLKQNLEQMISDSREDGIELNIVCGYVTAAQQQEQYDNTINYYRNELGYSLVKAQASTMRDIPDGESSEHRTGLLVKFDNSEYDDFSKSNEYAWLYRNSVKYGFVLRYPKDKISYTGMNASYSEFRYVGIEHAKKMRILGMCLEEYCKYLDSQ